MCHGANYTRLEHTSGTSRAEKEHKRRWDEGLPRRTEIMAPAPLAELLRKQWTGR
jgi:hypothetical protein